MSATGRSVGYERHPDDFYATPYWCTRAVQPHLRIPGAEGLPSVLDPFAGEGAILDCFSGVRRHGIEIDVGRAIAARVTPGNALDPSVPWPRASLIITNPPYSLASESILRALMHAAECKAGGIDVAFLLRINFLGAQKRADFHKKHPADIFVLPRRPSFVCSLSCENKKKGCRWGMMIPYLPTGELRSAKPDKCGECGAGINASSSDATEYAWFVWGPGRGGTWKILDVEAA